MKEKIIQFPNQRSITFPKGFSGRLHTCNVCGFIGPWGDNWLWKYIIHGKGYAGWEEEYKMCSDDCVKWAMENVKWRQK